MQKAGALRVHLGQKDRVERQHSNPDIDTTKSHLNYCIGCKDYEDAYQSMRKRVKEVDTKSPPKRLKNANQRIVAMSLIAYCPQAIVDQGREDEFFQELHGVYQDFLGDDLHGQIVHKDEIHQYVDPQTHETKTSLPHSHTLASAYVEWTEKDKKTGEVIKRQGINGKNFSSTARINQLNAAVDKMCREKFGVPYVTGAEKKKGKSVEQLKAESQLAKIEKETEDFVRSLEPEPTKTVKNFLGKSKEVPKTDEELQRDREVLAAQAILKDKEEVAAEKKRIQSERERNARERAENEADRQAMNNYLTDRELEYNQNTTAIHEDYKRQLDEQREKHAQETTELRAENHTLKDKIKQLLEEKTRLLKSMAAAAAIRARTALDRKRRENGEVTPHGYDVDTQMTVTQQLYPNVEPPQSPRQTIKTNKQTIER